MRLYVTPRTRWCIGKCQFLSWRGNFDNSDDSDVSGVVAQVSVMSLAKQRFTAVDRSANDRDVLHRGDYSFCTTSSFYLFFFFFREKEREERKKKLRLESSGKRPIDS